FIEKEKELKQLKQASYQIEDPIERAKKWIQEQEQLKLAEAKLAKQEPKVNFLNRILATEDNIDIGQTAKVLGLPFGRNILFRKLREKGIFFKNTNEPK